MSHLQHYQEIRQKVNNMPAFVICNDNGVESIYFSGTREECYREKIMTLSHQRSNKMFIVTASKPKGL